MATYRFSIRKHIRDDMYANEFVEVELTEAEASSIRQDDGKYSKCSLLVSSKLGYRVEAQSFPSKVETYNYKKKTKEQPTKKSFFKPWWAIPFKLIWWIIKLPFKLFL